MHFLQVSPGGFQKLKTPFPGNFVSQLQPFFTALSLSLILQNRLAYCNRRQFAQQPGLSTAKPGKTGQTEKHSLFCTKTTIVKKVKISR